MGPSKESFSLLYKAFLWPLLAYASPRWFLFLSVTNITKLEHFHRAASCTIYGCLWPFSIPLLFFEACLPPQRVTLTHLTLSILWAGSSSPNLLSHFRFGQTRSETKTLLILLKSFCVHSNNSCFLLLPQARLLLVLPLLLGIFLPLLWSPPSPLHAPSLLPRCGSRSPWLTPSLRSGALDKRLCSFFFWQERLLRTCQLLSLWQWGHSFLFSRPSMLKFFH